ncbi:MAG: hypothetical protein WD489_08050 [Rhodovibrionaceae bacterium]
MFKRSIQGLAIAVLAIGFAAPALAQQGEEEQRLDALIGELQSLIERGEEKREADPWFLQDLKDLVRKYDWPWQVVLYDQSFLELGDNDLPPGWKPLEGRYRMEPNAGYRTMVETRPEQQGQRSNEEVVGALVGTLLSNALNKNNNNSSNSSSNSQSRYASALAVTEIDRQVTNAFALTLRLSLRPIDNTQGKVGVGPYQGEATGGGYRLYYLTGSQPGERRFELLRRSSRGTVSTIEFYEGELGIEDGEEHEILWTRDRDGRMTVSLDGQQIMSATDKSFGDPFDGMTFINTGGDAAVSYMKIEGTS